MGESFGYALTDPTPVHASLREIRQRLPRKVFEAVFRLVLALLEGYGLLRGQTLGNQRDQTGGQRGDEEHCAARQR